MKNPFKKETVYRADYDDVEEFIQKFYEDPEYEFVVDMESHNDTSLRFNVNGKLDDWSQKKVEEFRAGKRRPFICGALLNDLCRQKIIKPGDYIVDVSW